MSIVETVPPRMSDMLHSGAVDAVATFEPIVSQLVAKGIGTKSADFFSADFFSGVNANVVASLWFSTRSWAETHRDAVAAFQKSLVEAASFIAQNPQRANEIETQYLKFSAPRHSHYDVALTPADLAFFVSTMQQLGLLHRSLNIADLVLK